MPVPWIDSKRPGQRYFEGYTLRETSCPDGKLRRKWVYTGIYYRQNLPERTRAKRRLCYPLAWLFSLLPVFYCGLGPFPFLNSWWGILSVFGPLLLLLIAAASFYHYAAAAGELTAYRYHKVSQLSLFAKLLTAIHSACAVLMLTCCFVFGAGRLAAALGAALHLAAAVLHGAVAYRESRVTYSTRRAE